MRFLIWVVVLAACAGVGAFIASRSNPFPPGVDDPGAQALPTGSEGPTSVRWTGSGTLETTHRLFVGGSCRTNWRLRASIREEGSQLTGRATASLIGDARCDFPTAQSQTQKAVLDVAGRVRGSTWRLQHAASAREPAGSIDLGALLPLLDRMRIELRVQAQQVTGTLSMNVPDGDRGSYAIDGGLTLGQQS
jgi:hypothetical protein